MNWNTLRGTLQAACDEPASAELAERAIEAAEIVASAAGEPPDELPDETRNWVETHGVPDDELVELAVRAMKCVALASDEWRDGLNDLRYRLGDIAAA
ncbi:MAG TPA: DUF4259 domain-containing protein [Gaiellaceae bacterium]|nr:DUF4259 domain-containing protein [Gaiellaceae bacterium]